MNLRYKNSWAVKMAACLFISTFGVPLQYSKAEDSTRVRKTILRARAVLPARSFADGPTSGTLIQVNPSIKLGESLPFLNKQPIQGFSAVHRVNDSTYMVMSDNGYGAIENSADFNLRVHTIHPDFKTAMGGEGTIKARSFIQLRDPEKKIPFTITNHYTSERVLTGADFDIESMQRASDGTLWFGDEFGPFLIHTDSTGKVLEAPYSLPDFAYPGKEIRSPQNPYYEEASALRILNALKTYARLHGNNKTTVFSPNYALIDDTNRIKVPSRDVAPEGLSRASSDIFNVSSIKTAGYPVVVWTVNDSSHIVQMIRQGVNGIISDNPDLLKRIAFAYDGPDAGTAPDFVDENGLLDITKFDAQGHRGGRDLRPENTLPAMEISLDNYMTTLELDCGVTADSIAVLSHDAYLDATKFRYSDGQPYSDTNAILIRSLTAAQIQNQFIADKKLGNSRPLQKNDVALSPVSAAFALAKGLAHAYTPPTLQNVFDFVQFYKEYYTTGAGAAHAEASKRALNAGRVRFNIETKMNPRTDADAKDNVFAERTLEPNKFTRAVAKVIVSNTLQARADIQSFDVRSILIAHKEFPVIRTVLLLTDGPKVSKTDDGTNLQPQGPDSLSPWLAGMYWPYRSSFLTTPVRAKRSGGFEGMALDSSKQNLLPLIELPLTNGPSGKLPMFQFNLASRSYTDKRWEYTLHPRGTNIGDFVMYSQNRGLVIERDGSEGKLDGFKAIYEIQLNEEKSPVSKRLAVDLLNIRDTSLLTTPATGDVGLGSTFSFPFQTIEDVVILGPAAIGVLNDNNFPFSIGRHAKDSIPDDNEFIIIELDRKLNTVTMFQYDTIGFYPDKLTGWWKEEENNYVLSKASPNPFHVFTKINIDLGYQEKITARVFDSKGQMIRTILEDYSGYGPMEITWDGKNDQQTKVAAGIYVIQLLKGSNASHHKVMFRD